MATDRGIAYQPSVLPVTGQSERDVATEAEQVAEIAKAVVDALIAKGFSTDTAVFLCGRVLDKMI